MNNESQPQQEIPQEPQPAGGMEAIFISGLDSSTTETDVNNFLSQFELTYEPSVVFHSVTIFERYSVLGEVELTTEDAVKILATRDSAKIGENSVKLIARGSMRSVIITQLPEVVSEKDLYLVLNKFNPLLKRVVIADDSELPGKSLGVAVATFSTYDGASQAVTKFNEITILGKNIKSSWKDPHFDIIGELAFETRILYVKNLSQQLQVPQLKELFDQHGTVLRIRKYARKAFIEFETISNAKLAYENLNEKRIDGLVLEIYPARKYDSEKERDLPDRNICFSKNFLLEEDQQPFLRYAHSGIAPELDEEVVTKCKEIVEAAKKSQQNQVTMLQNRINNLKNMPMGQGQDSWAMMMMLMQGMGGQGMPQGNPMMMNNMMNQMGQQGGYVKMENQQGQQQPGMQQMQPQQQGQIQGQNPNQQQQPAQQQQQPNGMNQGGNMQQMGGMPGMGGMNPMMGQMGGMGGMNPMMGQMGQMGGMGGMGGMNPMMGQMNQMGGMGGMPNMGGMMGQMGGMGGMPNIGGMNAMQGQMGQMGGQQQPQQGQPQQQQQPAVQQNPQQQVIKFKSVIYWVCEPKIKINAHKFDEQGDCSGIGSSLPRNPYSRHKQRCEKPVFESG